MADPKTTTANTQPKDENAMAIHREDLFHLVIGFEVNDPHAYREVHVFPDGMRKVHFVLEDPGHTFMYLTKNRNITFFYSLGPLYNDATRRAYGTGTPEYHITGRTRLFRFNLKESQYEKMLAKGKEYRADVLSGERYYNIFHNFTCARSARDIIAAGWPSVPAGTSFIGKGIVMDDVVNPYAFYEDIHKRYAAGEIVIEPDEDEWQRIMAEGNKPSKQTPDPTLNPSTFGK